jgi:LmbE family N-acetylglucosaminyl deacetylase
VKTFLHLAPHPDDESIAAVATLLALREAGHRVINLACSLGEPTQRERRRGEVEEARRRAGFELIVQQPPLAISFHDDRSAAQRTLTDAVRELVVQESVDVVVSPSPHDGHHGHEVVGRAARDAVRGPRLWLWGLWADLPWPTLYHGFEEPLLERSVHVLEAHAGELARNDYRDVVRGRAAANRSLGAERVFGFGSPIRERPYAELLRDPPPEGMWRARPIGWWLYAASFGDQVGRNAAAE